MLTLALLCGAQGSVAQNSSRQPAPADPVVLKLAPGRWIYDVQGDVRSIETREFRLEKRDGRMVETPTGGPKISYFDRRGFETEATEADEGRIVWKYDAVGRPAEMITWLAGVPLARDVYLYDMERRTITTESYYFGSAKLTMREVATFDARWNQTRKETVHFDVDGQGTQSREVYIYNVTYDARGRVVASSVTDERGALTFRDTQEYDDANRLVKSVYYEYDANSSRLISKSVGAYDGGGLLESYSHYDAGGRLVWREETTRERDARGNWITERRVTTEFTAGVARSSTLITRRKITFY